MYATKDTTKNSAISMRSMGDPPSVSIGACISDYGSGAINCCLQVCATNFLSLRTRPQPGVAIPLLRGEMYRKVPGRMGVPAVLVGIVTWFLSTGGLPRQRARWLAMTAKTYKHQFISVLTKADNLIPHLLRCRCRGGYQPPETLRHPQHSILPETFKDRTLSGG